MKKYTGKSIRNVETQTGKLPNSFGFAGRGGGYIRPLTIQETESQKKLGAFHIINGKIFNGNF